MWTWTLVHSSKKRGQFEPKTETMEKFESWRFQIRKNSSLTDSRRSYHQTRRGRERDQEGLQGSKCQGDEVRSMRSDGFTRWFIARQRARKRIGTDVKMETCEKSYCC